MFETGFEFVKGNIVASYGAVVGTLALILNFMRYRHAVSGTKVRLNVEILVEKSREAFVERIEKMKEEAPEYMQRSRNSEITHKIRVRNVGNVAVNIQDVWLETKGDRVDGTVAGHNSLIYQAVSQGSEIELPARTSKSFSCFSKVPDGYLVPVRACVVDATGKKWRSRRSWFGGK
ncbi:MAG: hypothetical protein KJ875_06785 [Alphaproteobacteria bacterium]|nr:hypothetical protein [Alphaproteobacteria bacterium]MBU2076501.1 hypothetical protein [Alphaproteobacteria bacterium]MBU2160604.1 hypothetical protein [Alphaproteobacteria bacterium]MBU2244408.1 hypothetical protein [Alphaproteobacteria bacterium]